jgi:hypothetical protein
MKTITRLIAVVFLCNFSIAQKAASTNPNGTFKAEKVQQNNNPAPKKVESPDGMPAFVPGGDVEQNFHDYIKAKKEWFKKNPQMLKDRVGITRVSITFLEGMSEEINLFVKKNKNQFEIIGQKKD